MIKLRRALDRTIPLTDAAGHKLQDYHTRQARRNLAVNALLRDELRVTGGATRQPVVHVVDVPKVRGFLKQVAMIAAVIFPVMLLATVGAKAIVTGAVEIIK